MLLLNSIYETRNHRSSYFVRITLLECISAWGETCPARALIRIISFLNEFSLFALLIMPLRFVRQVCFFPLKNKRYGPTKIASFSLFPEPAFS